jgi:hypothetical protein
MLPFPVALTVFALMYAKYKHISLPIEIAPLAVDLLCILVLLPMIVLLLAVALVNQAFDLKFIRCPRCSKPVFDSKTSKEQYPQCCCHCGFDIGPCES